MSPIDPLNVAHGAAVMLEPGLRRIVAPNPSAMTQAGTNTYLVGFRNIAVVDPGPACDRHLDAILSAMQPGQRISHIFVTHAHLDHSELAQPLAQRTGAPVLGFGPAHAGRSAVMERLARNGMVEGGEGVDAGFHPDVSLHDGETIVGDGWRLEALHTPGHIGNHLCLAWNNLCLTGDLVMGWSTSLVSPPDGDLADFMTSCRRLSSRNWRVFHPGHGAPVADPALRLAWLIAHRETRSKEILGALAKGPRTLDEITGEVYRDLPTQLLPAARRNVFAHLIDLTENNELIRQDVIGFESFFSRT